jgi:hypothetical protein
MGYCGERAAGSPGLTHDVRHNFLHKTMRFRRIEVQGRYRPLVT